MPVSRGRGCRRRRRCPPAPVPAGPSRRELRGRHGRSGPQAGVTRKVCGVAEEPPVGGLAGGDRWAKKCRSGRSPGEGGGCFLCEYNANDTCSQINQCIRKSNNSFPLRKHPGNFPGASFFPKFSPRPAFRKTEKYMFKSCQKMRKGIAWGRRLEHTLLPPTARLEQPARPAQCSDGSFSLLSILVLLPLF